MHNVAGRRIDRSAVFASLGLGTNLLWCTLAGHTGGFPSSLHDLDPAVNPRLFFLLGILAVGVAFALAPRWLRERDRPFSYVLPLASSVGTASFALASHQSLFDPIVLAVAGLIVFGAGYFWIASRFYLLFTRTQTFACTAWCIVAALGAETLALPIVRELVSSTWQIVITIALPLVSAALFKAARTAAPVNRAKAVASRRSSHSEASTTLAAQPRRAMLPEGHEGRRSLLVLVAAAALLLATVRSFSSIGLWGSEAAAQGMAAGIASSLASTAILALFAYATLVKTTRWRLDLRFQPAFIIVIGGLFLVVSQNPAPGIPAALLDACMRLDDSCAHVLFWIVVVTAIDALTMPSYRVMGIAAAIYALSSMLWVALLGSGAAFSSMVMLGAAYSLTIAAILSEWMGARRLDAGDRENAAEKPATAPENPPLGDLTGEHVSRAIAVRCKDIAAANKLSPRETEIFILLAQGRTRTLIQEELVLAENTVKTHIAHIYAKLGIGNRQEMMDLVLGAVEDGEGASR